MTFIKREARLLTLLFVAISVLVLASACETMEGAGRDIEDAGQAIQKEADD
ncbi:entericidin A/B family lipoprotein [Sneathiella sp.]|uniref:entericidin A/B family lipoprotein n=1 Tax=Sneathiella sp. TaxID=1964365 RepID=UPI002603A66A|nr:entericidin A/B family lipoprotein [Sneathiella sp.]MDF2368230.1 entericidin A/B family lipoprotein [Sneathiella sp.]